jgi:hypothetical protein
MLAQNLAFYTQHKKYIFLVKQFYVNIECQELCAEFFIRIFKHLEIYLE